MWKKVIAVILLVLLAAAVGYVLGVRAVMQRVCQPVEDAVKPKGIPYPGMICEQCFQNYPDWWCYLGGCPW